MKKLIIFFLFLLVGCVESKVEKGLNLHQMEYRVKKSQVRYMQEMNYVFSDYDLVLYDLILMRDSTYFYFVGRDFDFKNESYYKKVKDRLNEKGWLLVERNQFGELYCNNSNQAIGITYPTNKTELDGVNIGYFTYQFFNKISVTLHYTGNNKSLSCKRTL